MSVLIDTNIIIDYLHSVTPARALIDKTKGQAECFGGGQHVARLDGHHNDGSRATRRRQLGQGHSHSELSGADLDCDLLE